MKINISETQRLLKTAAEKIVSPEEAKYFAQEQIENHLKNFPRTNSLGGAVNDLEAWPKKSKTKIEVQMDKGASLLLNFNKFPVSPKIKYIHDELEKRAKKYGIAVIGLNNSFGIDDLNLWADGLSKRGLIGFCFFNGGPDSVVPYGGTQGIFGTNPLSYAIPTYDKPITVDMATSEIPYFEIRGAKKNNTALKVNAAVDSDGLMTTDPNKALSDKGIANLLPMGAGYKGYAMVLLVEILTGSLVRSFLSTEMTHGYVKEEHGGLIMAIDISSFTDLNKFKKSVSKMCEAVKKQKPAKGVEKITIPGDRSYERMDKALAAKQIDVPDEILDRLKKLAS